MTSVDGAKRSKIEEQLESLAVSGMAWDEVLNVMIQTEKAENSAKLTIHAQELARLNEVGVSQRTTIDIWLHALESVPGTKQFAMDSPGRRSGGGRAPRMRIPDPGPWKLEISKNKDDNFHSWCENV